MTGIWTRHTYTQFLLLLKSQLAKQLQTFNIMIITLHLIPPNEPLFPRLFFPILVPHTNRFPKPGHRSHVSSLAVGYFLLSPDQSQSLTAKSSAFHSFCYVSLLST